jgi:hypothetical protein
MASKGADGMLGMTTVLRNSRCLTRDRDLAQMRQTGSVGTDLHRQHLPLRRKHKALRYNQFYRQGEQDQCDREGVMSQGKATQLIHNRT